MSPKQFLQSFPKHLIVTPKEGSTDGWKDVKRDLPEEQVVGRAVYFTPNGFDVEKRGEEDVVQFNSVYIDVDADKESTPDEVETYVKKKTGEVFGLIEPTYIVRTKNGAHFHFLLETPVEVTEESRRNYIHVMDSMVDHFNADTGAKGINRVLRVPGFKHYKDINDPAEVFVSYESPDTRYTLEQIAEAIGIEYPAPVKESVEAVYGSLEGDSDAALEKMLERSHIKELWDGEVPQDQLSESDMSLCSHLAFWLQKDPAAMETAWLSSPLGAREKTQKREDYRKRTIDNAIAGTTDVYTPKKTALGSVEKGVVSIPEREEYLTFLTTMDWDENKDIAKMKRLRENYVNMFHVYFAQQQPNLVYEKGEDKVYWGYNEDLGYYEEINHSVVRGLVSRLLEDEDLVDKATESNIKNILARYRGRFVQRGKKLDDFDKDDTWFHASNGWVNIKTLDFEGHTPNRLSLRCSDVAYDRDAKCPRYDKFLDEDMRLKKDQVRVIDQFSGLLLTQDVTHQKMLTFIGRPGSGKSTIAEIWSMVMGDLSIQKQLTELSGDSARFAGASMIGRRLCWFDEVSIKKSEMSNALGTLISGEQINVERKGINGIFKAKNGLKCMLTANLLPHNIDPGIYRRLIKIDLDYSFYDEGTQEKNILQQLKDESSGILNRMIVGLHDVRKMGGFTMIEGHAEAIEDLKVAGDTVAECLDTFFEPSFDEEDMVENEVLLNTYKAFTNDKSFMLLTPRKFSAMLKSQPLDRFKHITPVRKYGRGRGWSGLKIKSDCELNTHSNIVYSKRSQEY